MSRPPFTPTIAALPKLVPFIGPEAMERARGRPFRARLGANESVFGASPKVVAVMREAAAENWKYSDPENYELRSAIAAYHGVPIECIVVGEGIDGLLGLTCSLFLTPSSGVVTTDGSDLDDSPGARLMAARCMPFRCVHFGKTFRVCSRLRKRLGRL